MINLSEILKPIAIFLLLSISGKFAEAQSVESIAVQAGKSTVWITYDHTNSNSGAVEGSTGSGFIVDSAGHVLTAYHVVQKWLEQIPAEQGKHPLLARIGSINSPNPIGMEIVDYNAIADVALLKLKYPNQYSALQLCFVSELPQGTAILAFGFPYAHELTPFNGLIANPDAPGARWSANIDFVEGVSGGPVFNMNGRVVGLVKGGYGDINSIRYITQAIRARSMLGDIGVGDSCITGSSEAPSVSKAALRVATVPDTAKIASGGFYPVDYRFTESKGVDVQIDTEDFQFKLPNGEPIGSGGVGAQILGGSIQVNATSMNVYHNNIYLPPEVAREAKQRGQTYIQLNHVFHGRDVNGNIFQVPSVLKIVIL